MNTCSVTLCEGRVTARGWCGKHYQRWAKHGDPEKTVMVERTATPEERLRHHGWKVCESGCWLWGGSTLDSGYGQVRLPRSMGKAHRVAYEVWVGPIPKGHVVRHTCDNPPCINPAHLVSGTNAENSRDMVDRGRSLVGERHHKARITEDDVRKIRAMQGTNKEIANAVGSTEHTVQDVRSGRSWKHIA